MFCSGKYSWQRKNRNPWRHQSINVTFLKNWVGLFQQRKAVQLWPEAGNLVVLCSVERFLGHAVSTVSTQPAVTKEVPHLSCLEVLNGHLVYIPFYKGNSQNNKDSTFTIWVILCEMQTLDNTCNFANWELQMAAKGENSVPILYVHVFYFEVYIYHLLYTEMTCLQPKPVLEYEQNVVKQTMIYFSYHE